MGDPPKPWVSICFNTQIAEIWMNWRTPQLPRPLCMFENGRIGAAGNMD